MRYYWRSFSWALSNGTGQEFGFAAGWKEIAGGGVEVDGQTRFVMQYCNAVL